MIRSAAMSESSARADIRHAEFLFGAPSLAAIRRISLPEVAIVGRSNVGKSTFINRLCGRKLARVSGRPGATRELNYYNVAGSVQDAAFDIALVDMPGFGFAKLSKREREQISELTVSFLRDRHRLHSVILLTDCRRNPEEDELAVQRLCANEGRHVLVVITKIDTLGKNDQRKAIKRIAQAYHLEEGHVLVTGEKISPAPIWQRLVTLI